MSRSSKGTFEPRELDLLRQIYDDLTAQAWFDQTDEAKQHFAKYLLDSFPGQTFDPARHKSVVETSARMFYSRAN